MSNRHIVWCALAVFAVFLGGWANMAFAQWPTSIATITTVPLIIVFALMLFRRTPKTFFYAALATMPYIALVITQIVLAPGSSKSAIVCFCFSLVYLATLKFSLRALHGTLLPK